MVINPTHTHIISWWYGSGARWLAGVRTCRRWGRSRWPRPPTARSRPQPAETSRHTRDRTPAAAGARTTWACPQSERDQTHLVPGEGGRQRGRRSERDGKKVTEKESLLQRADHYPQTRLSLLPKLGLYNREPQKQQYSSKENAEVLKKGNQEQTFFFFIISSLIHRSTKSSVQWERPYCCESSGRPDWWG